MKLTRLASRNRPISRKQIPAATALIVRVATMVTNSALPCMPIVEPMTTRTTMEGDGMAETAPRYPPVRATTRHTAKLPNRTMPMPCETYGANGPEKTMPPAEMT